MRGLLSVYQKEGLISFAAALHAAHFTLISTGGTSKTLSDGGIPVTQVSDVTQFPELLEGRVKTLHPNIHAAILAKFESEKHKKELEEHKIEPIELVVVNLYPFEETIAKPNVDLQDALENIDIGGVALLRAAAKNFERVVVVVDPKDYSWISQKIQNGGINSITFEERKKLALKAFQHTSSYDSAIASYLTREDNGSPNILVRSYEHQLDLKYGVNPHQIPAAIYKIKGLDLPFKVLHGTPGYINFMDALNAWQLVKELKECTGLPAAASFKHVSPAGAAVAVPLTTEEQEIYEVQGKNLTLSALAYVRARNADPMSSYGDFAALSDVVDEETANILKIEVSDGIIAPGFDEKALEILKQKKGGKYIVIQADLKYSPPLNEIRELYGVTFFQRRNDAVINKDCLKNIVTTRKELSEDAQRDLLVATITLKYTQSNSVGYAIRGQMIGVGAGQQSRVDCAKLAGSKVKNWYLRFHPKIVSFKFKASSKRVDRINARVHFIDNNIPPSELELFEEVPPSLSQQEKEEWMQTLVGVSLSSDAFFPFRDSIDVCAKLGVNFVAHPGGSIQDESVTKAADEYQMVMVHTGVRLFHH